MNLTEAWNIHVSKKAALQQKIEEIEGINAGLINANATLTKQLEDSNTARTTPGGYVVDASGPEGQTIDQIIASASAA